MWLYALYDYDINEPHLTFTLLNCCMFNISIIQKGRNSKINFNYYSMITVLRFHVCFIDT